MAEADIQAAPVPVSAQLNFFAGTVAGVASLLCGHPMDTLKVRLQCQNEGDARKYGSAMDAFRTILKEEKVGGLYKGVMSPMLGVAAVNASVFGFYGLAMRLQLSNPTDSPTLTQITLAGSASGILTSVITCPIERLKVLQQSAPRTAPQPSLIHLLRTSSIRSIYRGITATILRDSAYGGYFLTYEAICRWPLDKPGTFRSDLREEVEKETREVSWTRLLVAGGAAGVVAWAVTFPVDVVKSRIQASEPYLQVPPSSSTSTTPVRLVPHPYRTTYSTFVNSYKYEGLKVFTAGLGPTLLRAIPVNMVCFFVFEAVVTLFR